MITFKKCARCELIFLPENLQKTEEGLCCISCASIVRSKEHDVSDCCWAEVYTYQPHQSMNPEGNIEDPVECCSACHGQCDIISITYTEMKRFRETGDRITDV